MNEDLDIFKDEKNMVEVNVYETDEHGLEDLNKKKGVEKVLQDHVCIQLIKEVLRDHQKVIDKLEKEVELMKKVKT